MAASSIHGEGRCNRQPIGLEHHVGVNNVPKRNGQGIELLADPMRRRMVAALALRPRRASSLALEMGLSRPATTRQLHLLRDAGLVRSTRSMADRRAILFTVDPRNHGPITAWLAGTEIGRPAPAAPLATPVPPATAALLATPAPPATAATPVPAEADFSEP